MCKGKFIYPKEDYINYLILNGSFNRRLYFIKVYETKKIMLKTKLTQKNRITIYTVQCRDKLMNEKEIE